MAAAGVPGPPLRASGSSASARGCCLGCPLSTGGSPHVAASAIEGPMTTSARVAGGAGHPDGLHPTRRRPEIPHFCWHDALGSVGACRLCAVRVHDGPEDAVGRIEMACMTPVAEGQRVSVADPEAAEMRKHVIEWLMRSHPHDCAVCEEGGACHLQDMTVASGHHARRYDGPKRTHRNQDLGPLLTHEMNRCIACYRCTRFYRGYAGGRDLDVMGAHDRVYFGRYEDGRPTSTLCRQPRRGLPDGRLQRQRAGPRTTPANGTWRRRRRLFRKCSRSAANRVCRRARRALRRCRTATRRGERAFCAMGPVSARSTCLEGRRLTAPRSRASRGQARSDRRGAGGDRAGRRGHRLAALNGWNDVALRQLVGPDGFSHRRAGAKRRALRVMARSSWRVMAAHPLRALEYLVTRLRSGRRTCRHRAPRGAVLGARRRRGAADGAGRGKGRATGSTYAGTPWRARGGSLHRRW